MIKTEAQVNAVAQMIDKEVRSLSLKLSGIELHDSWIHIAGDGNADVILAQKMKDDRVTCHTFDIKNGVMSNYAVNVYDKA